MIGILLAPPRLISDWLRSRCLSVSRCERSFSVVSINAIVFPLIDLYSSIAAGLGFGAMYAFMYYAIIISHAVGDGALFNPHCNQFSAFFSAAWMALFFCICHICWMVIAFDAYRVVSLPKIATVIALHAAAGSFVSNTQRPCY